MKKGFLNGSKGLEGSKASAPQEKEAILETTSSPRDVTVPPPPNGSSESPTNIDTREGKVEGSSGGTKTPDAQSPDSQTQRPQPKHPQPSSPPASQQSSPPAPQHSSPASPPASKQASPPAPAAERPPSPPKPPKPLRPKLLSEPQVLRITNESATISWPVAVGETEVLRPSGPGDDEGSGGQGAEGPEGQGASGAKGELEADLKYWVVVKEQGSGREVGKIPGLWNQQACGGKGGFVAEIRVLSAGNKYKAHVVINSATYGSVVIPQTCSWSTPPACPVPPSNPAISGKGKSWIKLRWPAPNARGEAIINYQVEMGAANHGVAEGVGHIVDHAEIVYSGSDNKCEVKHLRPGVSYGARVRAQNAIGWSGYSAWTVVATSATVPQPPGIPFVAQLGVEWMQIAWQPPMDSGGMDVDSYLLEIWDGSEAGWTVRYNGSESTFLLQNTVPGHKYSFRVKACNAVGASPFSPVLEANGCCGPPGPPTNMVQIGEPAPFSIKIAWTPPLKDNGSPVQIYQAAMRRIMDGMPVGYWEIVYSGPATSCEVNGLFPASLFEFAVMAISALGNGPPCPSACFATGGAPPTAPPPVVLLGSEEGSLNIGWNLPDLCNGAPVTSFRLESVGPDESMSCVLYEGSSISHWVKGLAPGINVWLRVSAANIHGVGPPSQPACFTTQCVAPSPPEAVYAFDISRTQASVAWRAPQNIGGSSIRGYRVQVTRKDQRGQEPLVLGSNGLPVKLENLELGATYGAKVAAGNAVGYGAWSQEHVFTTEPGPPSVPEAPVVGTVTANSISLSWVAPICHQLAPVEYYNLQMHNGREYQALYTGSLLSFQVSGLQPGTQYKFRVKAGNSKGESGYSPVAATTTGAVVPGPPLALTTLGVSSNSIKFKWNAPAFQGGSSIYAYSVMMREEVDAAKNRRRNASEAKEVWAGAATTCRIKCNAETAYEIWVVALNAVGAGAPSAVIRVSTPAVQAVPVVPKAPSTMPPPNLQIRNSTLAVSWTVPKDAIPPARQYFLQVSSDETEDQEINVGNATAHEIYGLKPGVFYHVRVSAENEQGRSSWSSAATASAKSVATKRGRVAPPTPADLELEKATKNSLRFKWQQGGVLDGEQSDGCRFKLELAEGGGSYVTMYTGTESASTVMKLNSDCRYRARVQAINKYGASCYCPEISVRTNAIPARSWHRIAGYFFSVFMILVLLYYFLFSEH